MSKESALSRYSASMEALEKHQEENKAVFDNHKNLVNAVIDAENELRDALAEANEGVSDGHYRVTVTPQTQTWADIDELDRAIAEGKASNELRTRIVKTQTRPARISITATK